jgi:hypothetical protein
MARKKKPTMRSLFEGVNPERFKVTTVRLTEEQHAWLERMATRLQKRRGRGKADASAVLRMVLDRAIAEEPD